MQTITLIGENISQQAIEAFSAMAQAMNPKYDINYVNSSKEQTHRLSKEDSEYLRKIAQMAESGELKTYTSQEFQEKMAKKGFAW